MPIRADERSRFLRFLRRSNPAAGYIISVSPFLPEYAMMPDDSVTRWLEQFEAGDTECQQLLDQLKDAELRQIALWKMEGDTNDEVAVKLGCAPASVGRRLALIRRKWRKEAADA